MEFKSVCSYKVDMLGSILCAFRILMEERDEKTENLQDWGWD